MARQQSIDQVADGAALLVGLGNPGPRYEQTRHNIGFMLVDLLAARHGVDITRERFKAQLGQGLMGAKRLICLKPQTFMNLSGQSVGHALSFFALEPASVIVAHDDIDLPFGAVRVKFGGGAGGHKGLRSLDELIGGPGYFRVRLGVGRPEFGDVSDYVLQRFDPVEAASLGDMLEVAANVFESLLAEGLKATQNRYHGETPRGAVI